MNDDFTPFAALMRAAGEPDVAVRCFERAFDELVHGETPHLAESSIEPIETLPHLDELEATRDAGLEAMARCCVLKLNGGLGTSMGLEVPKSLVAVRDERTFLDVIVAQVAALRERIAASHGGAAMPLVLMNSFSTEPGTAEHLRAPSALGADTSDEALITFLQHRVPKIDARTHGPAEWPPDPEKTWCPPGHGDLYPALLSSGVLDRLRERGIRWAFVSNIDNLGATFDPSILGHMVERDIPFLMEVTPRTEVDRKGGHLARLADGRLGLREVAQCPDEDLSSFQDIRRHRFFNTNNLWLDLDRLGELLERHDGVLPLPVIQNRKTVDPTDGDSPAVLQLETAMGAALSLFDGAAALVVPRRRFAAVKTCGDLLAVASDAYVLTDDHRIELAPGRDVPPVIDLDARFYKRFEDFSERFPAGPPSLVACERLSVTGDVRFGANVRVSGTTSIERIGDGRGAVGDGAELSGAVTLTDDVR